MKRIEHIRQLIIISIFVALIMQLSQNFAYAQLTHENFYFKNSRQKQTTIPFRFISNLIIIQLKINDSDTMNFVLDTGLRTTIITEIPETGGMTLQYARKTKIGGLGEGESIEVLHSFGNTILFNDIIGNNQSLFVLLDDRFELSTRLGMPVNGIIGYDLLKDFVLDINYQKKHITLIRPDAFKYSRSMQKNSVPIEIIRYKPYIEAEVNYYNGTTIPCKLLIDTGASDALWLFLGSDSRIQIPEVNIQTFLGKGLNGDIHGKRSRLQNLRIGNYVLNEPTVAFPDSNSIMDMSLLDGRNGSIGSEILRRFRIVIDYPNLRFTFLPNNQLNTPFSYNMSGIEISTPIPGFPYYEISKIVKDSPADKAGLQQGDQIIHINYKPAFEYSLNEINVLFQSKKGKKIKMRVLRAGEKIKVDFFLENIL